MHKTSYTKRITTEGFISPDEWQPISQWLKQCDQIDPTHQPPYLFIDEEALTGINTIIRKTKNLHHHKDLKLRLKHDDMANLITQLRFWESAIDELHPKFQQIAPTSWVFLEAAINLQSALQHSPIEY